MTIQTNDGVNKFGTRVEVSIGTGTGSIAAGVFSVAGDAITAGWTHPDDTPGVSMVFVGTFAAALAANQSIQVYARLMDLDGTTDAPVPTANFQHKFIGSFPLPDAAGPMAIEEWFPIPEHYAGQKVQFYIKNGGDQILNTGWKLYAVPITVGPKA